MAKTLPIVLTNDSILVLDRENNEFKNFTMPNINPIDTIPFYHQFANKISECQYYFKEFVKKMYGKKTSKFILALIVPDDTSALERIFIKEFFLHSGVGKEIALMPMGQAISKAHSRYITVSKSKRNVILQYINAGEIRAQKLYPIYSYTKEQVIEDARRLHIDIEYSGVPLFVNNLNMNMDDFFDDGEVITTKDFLDKMSVIDVEKI